MFYFSWKLSINTLDDTGFYFFLINESTTKNLISLKFNAISALT